MKYVQIETQHGMINLDGYSDRKTLRGALKDLPPSRSSCGS
jgi:hypothetical protein